MPKPKIPPKSTGLRPMRSDSAPKRGKKKNWVRPNAVRRAPNHKACSRPESVSVPIKYGNTGTIRPMPSASKNIQMRINITAGVGGDCRGTRQKTLLFKQKLVIVKHLPEENLSKP